MRGINIEFQLKLYVPLQNIYQTSSKGLIFLINGLLKLGIKISDVCLKFETNVSEHKTISNDLET